MALIALRTPEPPPTALTVDIRRSTGLLAELPEALEACGPSTTTTPRPPKLMAGKGALVEPRLLVAEELAALREPLPILEQGLLVLTERMEPGMELSALAEAAVQVGSGSTRPRPR